MCEASSTKARGVRSTFLSYTSVHEACTVCSAGAFQGVFGIHVCGEGSIRQSIHHQPGLTVHKMQCCNQSILRSCCQKSREICDQALAAAIDLRVYKQLLNIREVEHT